MAERKVRLIDVEALWRIERIGAVSLSPDGAQAVCSVTQPLDGGEQGRAPASGCSRPSAASRAASPPAARRTARPPGRRKGERIAFVAKREQEGQKDDTAAALPDRARRRRGAPHQRFRARHRGLQVVRRRPPHRLRLLGLARAEGRQGAGQALEGVEGAQGKRLRHLARRSTATGTATCRWAGSPTCTCSTSPAAASSTCSRAPTSSCSAWTRTPTSSTSRPTAGTSPSSSIPRRRSASTTARRWPRSTSPAAAARRLAIDPAWDFEAPRYAPDGRRIAFLASNIGRRHTAPANAAVLERGGSWQRAHRRLGPCGQRAAALVGRRQRALVHRRGPGPRPSLALRDRERAARRSPSRAAGCTGSTSPATPSSPSPTR